ncbi:MAG: serine protease [Brachybacterium faecium]|nr:MAG: serine protease [Brachybacterium faecium]
MTPMQDHPDQTPNPWEPVGSPTGPSTPLAPAPGAMRSTPAPSEPPRQPAPPARRGPGWGGVSGLVLAGMLLSSGATLGSVIAYDQIIEPLTASTQEEPPEPSTGGTDAEPASSTTPLADWSEVAEQVAPSAVAISVRTSSGAGQGTGVVLSTDGSILTNNHVVAGAEQVNVTLADGLTYTAGVVGVDPSTDLAVIRLEAPPSTLQPATFGDSELVEVGDPVMAVGTPLGLENTVTTGIVSAVDRPVTTEGEEDDGSDATYTSALQTDAAINPGNSGGPLVDAQGRVVGINTAIAAIPGTDRSVGSIGLGFAIPSNTARMIAEQLGADGTVRHAFVGVTTRDGSRTVGDVTHRGAEVVGVESDSPASAAGMREGDLVTAFDDVTIGGAAALTGVVRGQAVGSEHELTVVRGDEERTITITLGERP